MATRIAGEKGAEASIDSHVHTCHESWDEVMGSVWSCFKPKEPFQRCIILNQQPQVPEGKPPLIKP